MRLRLCQQPEKRVNKLRDVTLSHYRRGGSEVPWVCHCSNEMFSEPAEHDGFSSWGLFVPQDAMSRF